MALYHSFLFLKSLPRKNFQFLEKILPRISAEGAANPFSVSQKSYTPQPLIYVSPPSVIFAVTQGGISI